MRSDDATYAADALAAWRQGLAAVDPAVAVRRALAARPDLAGLGDGDAVVAVGKAAAGMARGFLDVHARVAAGGGPQVLVLLPRGVEADGLGKCAVVLRGGHPWPTRESVESTQRILEAVVCLPRGARLLVLLSGGASALLEAPAAGLSFEDVEATGRALVASGLAIGEVNLVRSCLSAVKAGGLAARAAGARVATLAISDVAGDDPAVIGSGPTVAPRQSLAQRSALALHRLDAVRVAVPLRVRDWLQEQAGGAAGARVAYAVGQTVALPGEAPAGAAASPFVDQSDAAAVAGDYAVIASCAMACEAARAELARRGYVVAASPGVLAGSTTEACESILEAVRTAVSTHGDSRDGGAAEGSAGHPRAFVFGGETTVALGASVGRGGRNLDLAARLALAIAGRDGVAAVVAGTDGIDGSSRAAGAVVDGWTASRAEAAGLPLARAIERFDTEPALDAAAALLVPGPTGTNVGDLAVVVEARPGAAGPG